MESSDALVDYLQVVMTTGVGPHLLEKLLYRFESPRGILTASPSELAEVAGVGVAVARRLRSSEFRDRARETLAYCGQHDIRVLPPEHSDFPRLLREIPDPPSVLYVRGNLQPSDGLCVAIVGTRGASQYGRSQAERFARSLARAGLTIVSGLARGIDSAAHLGRSNLAGGRWQSSAMAWPKSIPHKTRRLDSGSCNRGPC